MSTQITTQVLIGSMSWRRRITIGNYPHVGQLEESIIEIIRLPINFAFEHNLIMEQLRQGANIIVGFVLDRPKIFTMLVGGN